MARQDAKTPRRKVLPPGHDNILWLDRIESDQTLVERLQLNSCLLCALATLRAKNLRMIQLQLSSSHHFAFSLEFFNQRPEFVDSVIEEISDQDVRNQILLVRVTSNESPEVESIIKCHN